MAGGHLCTEIVHKLLKEAFLKQTWPDLVTLEMKSLEMERCKVERVVSDCIRSLTNQHFAEAYDALQEQSLNHRQMLRQLACCIRYAIAL